MQNSAVEETPNTIFEFKLQPGFSEAPGAVFIQYSDDCGNSYIAKSCEDGIEVYFKSAGCEDHIDLVESVSEANTVLLDYCSTHHVN